MSVSPPRPAPGAAPGAGSPAPVTPAARFAFRVEGACPHTRARAGLLETPHGAVRTPVFMPVGTRGTVKGIAPRELREIGTQLVLANTYHLHLRPGEDTVAKLGGLQRFSGWNGPMLTDSGGYQVFSLGALVSVDDEGANLKSVVDGRAVRFTPERVVEIQAALGADVAMAFDHCASDPLDRARAEDAERRTARWLERSVRRWRELGGTASGQALFGIVQGGAFPDLRRRSAEDALAHDLPGYAIGGVSVGEERQAVLVAIESAAEILPADRPRYLMGVGTPEDFLDAIERGVDLFDCVTPTRNGRNHQAFTSRGRLNLRNQRHALETGPLDASCDCYTCRTFSRGYLRHLAQCGEMLAGVLLTLHNLRFFHRLLEEVRDAIPRGEFPALARTWRASLAAGEAGTA